MFQVPQETWNEIAEQGNLISEWANQMFRKTSDEVLKVLEQQGRKMREKGYPDIVILAYQQTTPLLLENRAISQYIIQTEQPELRGALPEILSPDEGVYLMTKEHRLNEKERTLLRKLLEKLIQKKK